LSTCPLPSCPRSPGAYRAKHRVQRFGYGGRPERRRESHLHHGLPDDLPNIGDHPSGEVRTSLRDPSVSEGERQGVVEVGTIPVCARPVEIRPEPVLVLHLLGKSPGDSRRSLLSTDLLSRFLPVQRNYCWYPAGYGGEFCTTSRFRRVPYAREEGRISNLSPTCRNSHRTGQLSPDPDERVNPG